MQSQSVHKGGGGPLGRLAKAHDAVTMAGFILGCLALAIIVVLFSYEIVARYFFRAPTRWSADYVSYALLISTFLVLPQLTRLRDYIAVTFLLESLPASWQRGLSLVLLLVSAVVCALAAWLCGLETLRQLNAGTRTMAVVAVPKWTVSIFIVYGLGNSAIYFLRSAIEEIGAWRRPPSPDSTASRAGETA